MVKLNIGGLFGRVSQETREWNKGVKLNNKLNKVKSKRPSSFSGRRRQEEKVNSLEEKIRDHGLDIKERKANDANRTRQQQIKQWNKNVKKTGSGTGASTTPNVDPMIGATSPVRPGFGAVNKPQARRTQPRVQGADGSKIKIPDIDKGPVGGGGSDPVSKAVNIDREKLANGMNSVTSGMGRKEAAHMGFDVTKGTVKASLRDEGYNDTWGGLAKATGKDMLKGAVMGGAAGGVITTAQGGDFWDGAKEGAFNGAVGWGGAHAYRRSIGAKTMFGKDGVIANTKNQYKAIQQVKNDGQWSKSALSLVNHRQAEGLSSAVAKRSL